MSAPSADRNLLFGLLALKMDLVSKDQLLGAMSAWLDRKGDPLGLVLREHGALSQEDCDAIDRLVDRHVARHGDPRRSLQAISVAADVRGELERSTDDAVRHSLSAVGTPPEGGELATFDPAPPPAGCRYRRLRFHARGGLGEVSVALDEELRREVALKEIRGENADRVESRLRFVREAEITGKLEHPGVVPVYGLGAYPDGRPYYAMRFIRGETMQEAVARFHSGGETAGRGARELALRELLGRFVAVCNAVGYAHSRGVIHRDIKPANIMLGEYGETLVVDWGLAKVPGEADEGTRAERPVEVTPSESGPTQTGRAVGTPGLMAPEQARGEHDKEGPGSDIFALGATLYCVLTGSPPYTGNDALARAARGDRRRAREVNARVPAELDAVCEKAMAAAPPDRYATARLLAADVERWLADEPVSACREPVGVRLRRWAKRHRTLVTSGLVLLAASVVGLSAGLYAVGAEKARTDEALVETREARDEADRRRVEEEKAKGEATRRRIEAETNLARAVNAEGSAKQSLALAERNLKLAKKAVDDTFGIAKDHPLFKKDDTGPSARALRKVLLEKALPFYQDFQVQRPDDAASLFDVSLHHFRLGDIHRMLGRRSEAVKHYAESERAGRELLKLRPDDPGLLERFASVLNNKGLVLAETVGSREAKACFVEAAELYRRVLKVTPKAHDLEYLLANTLANLGREHLSVGQISAAIRSYDEAVAAFRRLVKLKRDDPGYHEGLASTLASLGFTNYMSRRPDKAAGLYKEGIAICRAVLEFDPGRDEAVNILAFTLFHRGNLHMTAGRREDAVASFAESAAQFRRLTAAHPDVSSYHQRLALVLNNRGNMEAELGRKEDAIRSFTEAIAVTRRVLRGPSPVAFEVSQLTDSLVNRAMARTELRLWKEAEADLIEAIALLTAERKRDPKGAGNPRMLAIAYARRAMVRGELKRHREALDDWDHAAALLPQARAAFRPQIAVTLAHAGEHDRAAAEAAEAVAAPRLSANTLYNSACAFAVSAAVARADPRRPLPVRERLAETRSRQAVALLERLAKAGYFKAPAVQAHLDNDTDLDSLRGRDDYKRIRAALPPPAAKPKP